MVPVILLFQWTKTLLFQDYPSLGFCAILFLVKGVPVARLALEVYPKGVDQYDGSRNTKDYKQATDFT